jgi:chaperone required for assembly of F1-ATPase
MPENDTPPQPAKIPVKVPDKVLGREPPPRRMRFYKAVTVVANSDGFGLQLDGRPLRTPRKLPLRLPNRTLAEIMAGEWDAQDTAIEPATMPVTTLVFTAIDAVADQKTAVAAEIGCYAASDLLCYRADAPDELAARQIEGWDPVLIWAEATLGVVFRRTAGLMPVTQDAKLATAVEQHLAGTAPLDLAATHVLTTLTGSAVLALAVRDTHLTLDDAWRLAHLDEAWQIERWGTDADAEIRHATRLVTARAAARVLALANEPAQP